MFEDGLKIFMLTFLFSFSDEEHDRLQNLRSERGVTEVVQRNGRGRNQAQVAEVTNESDVIGLAFNVCCRMSAF